MTADERYDGLSSGGARAVGGRGESASTEPSERVASVAARIVFADAMAAGVLV
jgi:hypothetical protein